MQLTMILILIIKGNVRSSEDCAALLNLTENVLTENLSFPLTYVFVATSNLGIEDDMRTSSRTSM